MFFFFRSELPLAFLVLVYCQVVDPKKVCYLLHHSTKRRPQGACCLCVARAHSFIYFIHSSLRLTLRRCAFRLPVGIRPGTLCMSSVGVWGLGITGVYYCLELCYYACHLAYPQWWHVISQIFVLHHHITQAFCLCGTCCFCGPPFSMP